MSWNTYIDSLIANSKSNDGVEHVDKVCIFGKDGSPWTTSDYPTCVKMTEKEMKDIARVLKSENNSEFQMNGIYCEGHKYQFLRELEGQIYGKLKGNGALTICATKTAILVAHCKEGGQQGLCNKAVTVISEYLQSMNM